MLFVDGPHKQIEVLNLDTLTRNGSITPVGDEQLRCALSVGDKSKETSEKHIFVGCTNGHLMRLDPVNFFTTMRVKLKYHIYCMLQLDENSILCG